MTGVIIKNQPNQEDVLRHVSRLAHRLGRLYLIPNWTEENAVLLAEWIVEKYKYEEIQIVTRVLNNPPTTGDKTWRLTPDVIQEWMTIELEKVAAKREERHNMQKLNSSEPVADIDYESFKKRIEQGCLNDPEKSKDQKYEEFKTEYLKKRLTQK